MLYFGDFGIGFEKQFKHFTIVPEFRYSYGKIMQTYYLIVNFKV